MEDCLRVIIIYGLYHGICATAWGGGRWGGRRKVGMGAMWNYCPRKMVIEIVFVWGTVLWIPIASVVGRKEQTSLFIYNWTSFSPLYSISVLVWGMMWGKALPFLFQCPVLKWGLKIAWVLQSVGSTKTALIGGFFYNFKRWLVTLHSQIKVSHNLPYM